MILGVSSNGVVGWVLLLIMQRLLNTTEKDLFLFLKYMFVIITALANKHGKMF